MKAFLICLMAIANASCEQPQTNNTGAGGDGSGAGATDAQSERGDVLAHRYFVPPKHSHATASAAPWRREASLQLPQHYLDLHMLHVDQKLSVNRRTCHR